MKNNFSKKAFTLIELIISLVLVCIIILGIISINIVLNNNNQDYGQRYLVKSETQITLNHILNNVALAYGSTSANDEAILVSGVPLQNAGSTGTTVIGPNTTFCIHQQANNNIIQSPKPGYNSAIWLCYTLSNSQINWCTETYTAGADPRGAAACTNASSNFTFLGTAYSMTPTFTVSSTQTLFSIIIDNCLNDSAIGTEACNVSGTSGDMANNPEVQLSGSTIPSQVSGS